MAQVAARKAVDVQLPARGPWVRRLVFYQLAVVVVEVAEGATAGRLRMLPAAATSAGGGVASIGTYKPPSRHNVTFRFRTPVTTSEALLPMGISKSTPVMCVSLVSLG